MVAIGTRKIKSLIDLKTNVDRKVADFAGPTAAPPFIGFCRDSMSYVNDVLGTPPSKRKSGQPTTGIRPAFRLPWIERVIGKSGVKLLN